MTQNRLFVQGLRRKVIGIGLFLFLLTLFGLGLRSLFFRDSPPQDAKDLPSCAQIPARAAALHSYARGEMAAFKPVTSALFLGDLPFQDAAGAPLTLQDLDGRVRLVNIWARWCPPCREEMPALDRLQAHMGGDSFKVVAINLDSGDPQKGQKFLKELALDALEYFSDPTPGFLKALRSKGQGAVGLPLSFLIDSQSCVLGVLYGPAQWDAPQAQALLKAVITQEQKN